MLFVNIGCMNTKKTIWVLEDDPSALFVYEDMLKIRYRIFTFNNLDSFIKVASNINEQPDLLISDLRLGEQSFLDFLFSDKSIDILNFPFIVVSNIDDLDILRQCFNEGAVDYLTKPFMKNELLVKIERLLFSNQKIDKTLNIVNQEDLLFDPYRMTLKRLPNHEVRLTAKELQLYSILKETQKKHGYLSRHELAKSIWGDITVSPKSLDVHLYHLRKKLIQFNIQVECSDSGYRLKTGS